MIHGRSLKTPIVLIGLLVFFALSSLALSSRADAGEVHFDPGSPAGKEYALPLPTARNEALGGGGGAGSVATAPLFGVGIGGGRGSAGGGHHGGGGNQGGSHSLEPENSPQGQRETGRNPSPTEVLLAQDNSYPADNALWMIGGLLLIGIVLGLGLRALARPRAHPV